MYLFRKTKEPEFWICNKENHRCEKTKDVKIGELNSNEDCESFSFKKLLSFWPFK